MLLAAETVNLNVSSMCKTARVPLGTASQSMTKIWLAMNLLTPGYDPPS